MSWTCPNCDARYPDNAVSRLGGERCVECTLVTTEQDLYDVYNLLAEATQSAATGDTNKCASLAADAKERVKEIHQTAANE